MRQFVIDLDKYDYIRPGLFRNRKTGRYVTPQVRNRQHVLVPVIIQSQVIEAAPIRLALPAPRVQVFPQEEKEKSDTSSKVKRPSEARKVFVPTFVLILFLSVFSLLATPIVVHHTQQLPIQQAQGTISQRLQRMSQLDPTQYTPGQYELYSSSACSAASMTEILNAYGGHYAIADILSVEMSLGVISPDQGLLTTSGIEETLTHFGFDAHPILGLDQIIAAANTGTPVIADLLPGTAWPGGHFLVVKGGTQDTVFLADSWSTNFTQVSRSRFLGWNIGQGWVVVPGPYTILQDPTLSVDEINNVLLVNESPANGEGQDIVNLSQQYHLDNAYILATFWHESNFGKAGEARLSKSPGNLRCADWITWASCQDNYAWFHSWQDGFKALYILLSGSQYEGMGLTTPENIIPKFAPSSDGNDESAYIMALKETIDKLRSGKTQL